MGVTVGAAVQATQARREKRIKSRAQGDIANSGEEEEGMTLSQSSSSA